jgi:hypothetical protein
MFAELTPEKRAEVLKRYHDAIRNPPEPSESLKEMVRKYGRFAVVKPAARP